MPMPPKGMSSSSYLLRSLTCEYSDLPLRQFDVGNIPVVSELLRIAQRHTQYELARRAVKALARDWPTTLSDWDFLQSHIARLADQLRANAAAHSTVSEYLATQLQDPALVLKLARFYGFGYPLVPVFLTLSQIPDLSSRDFEALFTFPNFSATHPARTSPRFRTADYSVVASADLVRLATARAHLREEQVSAMRLLVPREDEPAPAASAASHVLPHHPQCMLALRGVVSSDEMLDFCFHVDALGLWKLVGDRMQAGIIGLCAECQALLSVHAQKERQRIWDRLPVLFQLGE
jgi:hypothetical protein